jgi:hypothetical protein
MSDSEKKLYEYDVLLNRCCTHRENRQEQYGGWSSNYSNSFEQISRSKKPGFSDLVSILNIRPGEQCIVVWIEWSTGDSFGRSHYGSSEAIGVFRNPESAQELSAAITNFRNSSENHKFKCSTSDGQKFYYGFAPWAGYFDNLESVNTESTIMTGVL